MIGRVDDWVGDSMARFLAVFLVLSLALTGAVAGVAFGISAAFGDHRPCLRSHTEERQTLILAGKVIVPVTETVTVCDKHAPEPTR